MNFTSLPNAIILNLFEYFSLTELFQYFSDLNSRLNKLLYYEFQKFHLDLRSLSKREVNEIYQNYIPSIINQNISIHLSNDYATPHQIQSFISHDDYKLRQFLHLQSISISNLQCKQTLDKIITECSNLPYLTHLTLIRCNIEMNESDKQHFYNQIWNLPKLKYCHLNIDSHTRTSSLSSAVISKSLKYLTVKSDIFNHSIKYHVSWSREYVRTSFKKSSKFISIKMRFKRLYKWK
ncbi:unnamed protein product [Adineta steineri]|uniref:F-box domain-containing protein n=1 Tax=Adineta steineri TaxID=433720 RepID=A0A815P0L4_9BILA|nr:unnamed protein product [Adineta steineri]